MFKMSLKLQILAIFLVTLSGSLSIYYWQSCQVSYSKLEQLLMSKQWIKADQETSDIIGRILRREVDKENFLGYSMLDFFQLYKHRSKILYSKGIPCNELQAIDKLWSKYSDKNFGLNVQAELALSTSKISKYQGDKLISLNYLELTNKLGWRHLKNSNHPEALLYFRTSKWYTPSENPKKTRGFLPSQRWVIENTGKPVYSYEQALVHFISCNRN
jgi:GUN4-like